jgi:hypothetical protein
MKTIKQKQMPNNTNVKKKESNKNNSSQLNSSREKRFK